MLFGTHQLPRLYQWIQLIQRSRLEVRQATGELSPGKNVESSGNLSSWTFDSIIMVSALAEKTANVQIWSKCGRSADSVNYFLRQCFSVFLRSTITKKLKNIHQFQDKSFVTRQRRSEWIKEEKYVCEAKTFSRSPQTCQTMHQKSLVWPYHSDVAHKAVTVNGYFRSFDFLIHWGLQPTTHWLINYRLTFWHSEARIFNPIPA